MSAKPVLLEMPSELMARRMANPEIERVVIWRCLKSDEAFAQARRFLDPEDFTVGPHRKLYETACRLEAEGIPPNLETVSAYLEEHDEFHTIGGISALFEIGVQIPEFDRIDAMCRVIRRMSIRRRTFRETEQVKLAAEAGELDTVELLESASQRIREMQSTLEETETCSTLYDSIERVGGIGALCERPPVVYPLPWGGLRSYFPAGGFFPGQLVILAGRPSHGKSTIASQMAVHSAIRGFRTRLFSLEMSELELLQRIGSAQSGVDHASIQAGRITPHERSRLTEALALIEGIPLAIDERTHSLSGILAALAKAKRRVQPYDVVFIDYLQLISSSAKRSANVNRTEEVSAITRSLKLAAKAHNCCIVALSQMSRAIETRGPKARPQLSDLRESGSIEQDADIVLFAHRPEVYKPDDLSLRNKAELIISKHRNGPVGTCELMFAKQCCRFWEEAHGEDM